MMNNKVYPSLILAGLMLLSSCEKKVVQKPPAAPVYVSKSIEKDVPIYFDYVGHIEAYSTVEIQSQVAGILVEQHFEQGDDVKKDDLLFVIDPRPYQAALAQAEATLAQNIATLKFSEETVRRYTKLAQEDYVAQLTFDQYVTNVAVDEAIIKQNIAQIETAKINLGYCYIRSPIDATTGILNKYVGNFITVGESTPLITLNKIDPIYLNFYVPEQQLPKILELQRKSALKVEAIVNQDFSKPYPGNVTLINNMVDQDTGMFLIQATLPNQEKILWPGEFVTTRLFLETQKNAVLIPIKAIEYGQNGPYAYVVKDNLTVELRNLTLGQAEGDMIIVNKGIVAGETIVVDGQVNLLPGVAVSIKEESK